MCEWRQTFVGVGRHTTRQCPYWVGHFLPRLGPLSAALFIFIRQARRSQPRQPLTDPPAQGLDAAVVRHRCNAQQRRCAGRPLLRPPARIHYLIIRYMVTPSPLGQTMCLTGVTNLVVEGTMTRPHAAGRVAKKEPVQTNPSQTPAPILAKTK
jgi:hypothetical protein